MINRMIPITLYTFRQLVEWVMLLALVWPLSSCSSSSGGPEEGGSNLVSWKDGISEVSASAGTAALMISEQSWAGTAWHAEIVQGDEWLSFSTSSTLSEKSGVVGETLASRVIYLYYKANTTGQERIATLHVGFGEDAPMMLTFKQRAAQGGGNDGGDDDGNGNGNGNGGGDVVTPVTDYQWPELPTIAEGDDLCCVSHFTPVKDESQGGKMVTKRNYTMLFDRTVRAARWVAYPLHSVYMGSSGRTEAWEYDPQIDRTWQPNIYKAYANGGTWHRGHQLPSADRTATKAMNEQTFYFSNMTPQNGTLNSNKWATLEGKVRNWSCSDTLYVVTGAHWASTANYTTDNSGNRCPTPTHYFKVVVRTQRGNVRKAGDSLGDYKASELQSIGFWVENKANASVGEVASWARSVAEIEQLTGHRFFPTIPSEVKQQKNTAQWGL